MAGKKAAAAGTPNPVEQRNRREERTAETGTLRNGGALGGGRKRDQIIRFSMVVSDRRRQEHTSNLAVGFPRGPV